MTAGKNPRNFKKKGTKKKLMHPFIKKEWYNVLAPGFDRRNLTLTPCNKSAGQKQAADSLRGRVFQTSLADCNYQSEAQAWRKLKFQIDEVKGFDCYTNFYGMDMSVDKLRSLVRKWHTLIETYVDVKTTDGYLLRLFAIGFTKRRPNQSRQTSYAQASQCRAIRKKMKEIMIREASVVDLNELVRKFIPEVIGSQIEKATQGIYPLQNVYIRKVKTLRAPKMDLGKFMELHTSSASVGKKVERPSQ